MPFHNWCIAKCLTRLPIENRASAASRMPCKKIECRLQIKYAQRSTIIAWNPMTQIAFPAAETALAPTPSPRFSCFDRICNYKHRIMNDLQGEPVDRPFKIPSIPGILGARKACFDAESDKTSPLF